MFQAIRVRRSHKKSLHEPLVKKDGKLRRIFRADNKKTATDYTPPSLAPAITFTLSEDECNASNVSTAPLEQQSQSQQQISEHESTFVFTEKQLTDSVLGHIRAIAKKEEEIARMKHIVVFAEQKHLNCIQQKEVELLHTKRELASVIQQLAHAHNTLDNQSEQLVHIKEELAMTEIELKECYQELNGMDTELRETKQELESTRQELFIVASSLMQAQHDNAEKDQQLESLRHVAVVGKAIGDGFTSFWPFG